MEWQGFALVITGAFFYAFFEINNKKLLGKGVPADCISTTNFLGSGVLLLVAAAVFTPPQIERWFDFPAGFFWPLLGTGLLNIFILFGLVRALKYGDVSLIAPISATQPMVVLIPSWIILRESPDALGYAGLFLLAIGVYIFSFSGDVYVLDPRTGEKKAWEPPGYLLWMGRYVLYYAPVHMLFRNKGVQIALMVAVCGAVAINFDKLLILRSQSVFFGEALVLLFCGIVGLAKIFITREWKNVEKEHLRLMAGNSLIFTLVCACYSIAFLYGFAAYVGALKRTAVVFVLILSWLLLKEQGVKKRWPGALIMTAGAALLSL